MKCVRGQYWGNQFCFYSQMCTYSKYAHAYLTRHPNVTCNLCPNPQITRATHCPIFECVCVCVCVRSHARNVKYDVLIDQVRWSWMDLDLVSQDYVHRKVDTYTRSLLFLKSLSVTVLFVASSTWCEVLTGSWTVPSRRDIHPVCVCHRTIQILYYHAEGISKPCWISTDTVVVVVTSMWYFCKKLDFWSLSCHTGVL